MASPLEGAIAKKIGKAMAGLFYDASVVRTETTGAPEWDPASGTTTTTSYSCKAFINEPTQYELANSLVQANQGIVTILQTTLAIAPTTADQVTIRGKAYAIVKVSADPANATWRIVVQK